MLFSYIIIYKLMINISNNLLRQSRIFITNFPFSSFFEFISKCTLISIRNSQLVLTSYRYGKKEIQTEALFHFRHQLRHAISRRASISPYPISYPLYLKSGPHKLSNPMADISPSHILGFSHNPLYIT
jgi:hypothetical protein